MACKDTANGTKAFFRPSFGLIQGPILEEKGTPHTDTTPKLRQQGQRERPKPELDAQADKNSKSGPTEVGNQSMKFIPGGQLKLHSDKWAELTSDPFILQAISGYQIEFKDECFPPQQEKRSYPYKRKEDEMTAIDAEIQKLLKKGVIEHTSHENVELISCIFTRPKKSGGIRIILDLSKLNESVEYHHFKMDNFHTAAQVITQDCYMASIDLQDAYYSVPIHDQSRKYLKFMWQEQLFQFTALPNGLSSAPRLFTKIMKPVFAKLRQQGVKVVGFIDDTLVMGHTKHETEAAVTKTKELMGFMINSREMTVRLPNDKIVDIIDACASLIHTEKPTIRHVARVIGKLVAAMPATQHGAMYYQKLEHNKIIALQKNKGHFDRGMNLSNDALSELEWWIENIEHSFSSLIQSKPNIIIQSDASGMGWGATNLTDSCGGKWNENEKDQGTIGLV